MQQTDKPSWGAPLVSGMVLAIYVVALGFAYLSADKEMLHTLTIVAATNATAVVSYWVGSSVGSARKDQQIAALAQTASAPAELPPKVEVALKSEGTAP